MIGGGGVGASKFITSTTAVEKFVILDTNALFSFKLASSFIKPGEIPAITQQVMREAVDVISRGVTLSAMPKLAKYITVLPDVVDVSTQAALRSHLGTFTSPGGSFADLNILVGLNGDGIIGTTILLTGRPIITGDRAFYNALVKMGGAMSATFCQKIELI